MVRIASFNINGIRATLKRGFTDWLANRKAQVVALQEVRCPIKSLPVDGFAGYFVTYNPGQLAGRNGVAILTQTAPKEVRSLGEIVQYDPQGFPNDFGDITTDAFSSNLSAWANEGRYLEVDLADHPITVACLYLPKGSTPEEDKPKYEKKMAFLKAFEEHLPQTIARAETNQREFLLVGDFNIAHREQDIKNWKGNLKSEGFLPEEREWIGKIIDHRLHDVIREQYPDQNGPYSWWSWRGKAFTNDAGWRIDYQLATKKLASSASNAQIDREDSYESRRSDHAAVVVDYSDSHLAKN